MDQEGEAGRHGGHQVRLTPRCRWPRKQDRTWGTQKQRSQGLGVGTGVIRRGWGLRAL